MYDVRYVGPFVLEDIIHFNRIAKLLVLEEVGIDYESEDFWRGGFEIIRGWMNELQEAK